MIQKFISQKIKLGQQVATKSTTTIHKTQRRKEENVSRYSGDIRNSPLITYSSSESSLDIT